MEGNWIIKQEDAPIPRLKSTSTMAGKFLRRTGNDRKEKSLEIYLAIFKYAKIIIKHNYRRLIISILSS